ncbi:BICD family-like cargo adapter 2 isoform X3 [Esox lucius]|uniref:BICD family-like cargo adapter 2 isoform X3 n=1 Tax=Esox lucius TaxID=8010 RepID=UPI0014772265|nr:BICD family-like cargo adapter 2 isoform X3 [Esox lucius]
MFSRKDSLSSPSLEDSFFPLSSSSPSPSSLSLSLAHPANSPSSYCQGGSGPMGRAGSEVGLEAGLETDLILAAELGQALLERNEELAEALMQRDREIEVLHQENHVLQRRLEVFELSSGQREAELASDISSLRAELEQHHSRGRDKRRDENTQLTELANHNHRLVGQLAEAVSAEHQLRIELRSIKEELEDLSLNRTISATQLDNTQAENRVLKEKLRNMEEQLRSWQADCDRLRGEKEGLRDRLTDLQTNLREKEAQATETLLAHSTILQDRDQEIDRLRKEMCSRDMEIECLQEELLPFRSNPGKPTYSSLESEMCLVRQERDCLTQQLLNTIQHKVALSQEVDAWQVCVSPSLTPTGWLIWRVSPSLTPTGWLIWRVSHTEINVEKHEIHKLKSPSGCPQYTLQEIDGCLPNVFLHREKCYATNNG